MINAFNMTAATHRRSVSLMATHTEHSLPIGYQSSVGVAESSNHKAIITIEITTKVEEVIKHTQTSKLIHSQTQPNNDQTDQVSESNVPTTCMYKWTTSLS